MMGALSSHRSLVHIHQRAYAAPIKQRRTGWSRFTGAKPCGSFSRTSQKIVSMFTSTSSNPAFTSSSFQQSMYQTRQRPSEGLMTVEGAVQKTGVMLACMVACAAFSWLQVMSGNVAATLATAQTAGIAALVTFFATTFKPQWSPAAGPLYAILKGYALGAISAVMEFRYPGIASSAMFLTFGTLGSLLWAYRNGVIRVTDTFRQGLQMVTGGYLITLLVFWLMSMLGGAAGMRALPSLFNAGIMGVGVSLVAAGLAASHLLVDMDFIVARSYQGAPKWMEWYSGFGLIVSLVWMYTSVLRLLSILGGGSRD